MAQTDQMLCPVCDKWIVATGWQGGVPKHGSCKGYMQIPKKRRKV